MDDESGLVYMRARYYEAGSGRFISQDARLEGVNWFAYCINNPVSLVDESGYGPINDWVGIFSKVAGNACYGFAFFCFAVACVGTLNPEIIGQCIRMAGMGLAAMAAGEFLCDYGSLTKFGVLALDALLSKYLVQAAAIVVECAGSNASLAGATVRGVCEYSLKIMGLLLCLEVADIFL
jgi:hypothetical protein